MKILAGHDLTTSGDAAVEMAMAFAEKLSAKVEVFHAIAELPYYEGDTDSAKVNKLYEGLVKKTTAALEKRVTAIASGDIKVTVSLGDPAEELLKEAESTKATHLFIGPGTTHDLSDYFLGTLPKVILRNTQVPLMVVRPGHFPKGKEILVPVDLNEASLAGLEHALKIADAFDLTVTCLYVQSPASMGLLKDLPEGGEDELRALLKGQKAKLDTILEPYKGKDRVKDVIIAEGWAGPEIVKAADAFDLVVMSSQAGSSFAKRLVGSTAEFVVEHSAKPVLAVRG